MGTNGRPGSRSAGNARPVLSVVVGKCDVSLAGLMPTQVFVQQESAALFMAYNIRLQAPCRPRCAGMSPVFLPGQMHHPLKSWRPQSLATLADKPLIWAPYQWQVQ